MAVALITTMYGSFMANALFSPAAIKLATYNAKEILGKNIIIEGVISIQAGDNPKVLEEKLKSFLSPEERAKIGGKEEM
jgi:chemotaxis protein MotA